MIVVIKPQVWLISAVGGLVLSGGSAWAQSAPDQSFVRDCRPRPEIYSSGVLECAEVYRTEGTDNGVLLFPRNAVEFPIRAGHVITAGQVLQTQVRSIAEMQFNEGTMAWLAPESEFVFSQGLRRSEIRLSNGQMLVLMDPGSGNVTVETARDIDSETATACINAFNSSFLVDQANGQTTVAALTGSMDIANAACSEADAISGRPALLAAATKEIQPGSPAPQADSAAPAAEPGAAITSLKLRAGELVTVDETGFGEVRPFDYQQLVENNPLVQAATSAAASGEANGRPATARLALNTAMAPVVSTLRSQAVQRAFITNALAGAGDGFLYGDADSLPSSTFRRSEDTALAGPSLYNLTVYDNNGISTITFTEPGAANLGTITINTNDADPSLTVTRPSGQVISTDAANVRTSSAELTDSGVVGRLVLNDGQVFRFEINDPRLNTDDIGANVGPNNDFTGTLILPSSGIDAVDLAPDY